MKINKICLKNWKNFAKAEVSIGNRAYLIGPNASGKSNFLDSLRFINDIAKSGGGLEKALIDRGSLKKIRSLSARNIPEVGISLELEDSIKGKKNNWNYILELRQESRGMHRVLVSKEFVKKNDKIILNRPDEKDEKDNLRLTQTSLEQINDNIDFRELYTFFQDINYLHLIPQIIRQPDLFFNTKINLADDSYGFHFIEKIMKTPKNTKDARLRKIEKALQIAVPQLKNLSESRDINGIPHIEALYEHWRPNAGKQQESQFSDGTIRLIGLLWAILENKSLLLLEEPELSLHPAIVKRIPAIINNLTKNKKNDNQILISTHSPDLLSDGSITASELVMLQPNKEGTEVRLANDIIEVKTLLESGIGADEVVISFASPDNIEQLGLFE